MGAGEDIDRIYLEQAQAVYDLMQMRPVFAARAARTVQALCGEHDTNRFAPAECVRSHSAL